MDAIMRLWRNLPLGSKLASLSSLLVVVGVLALTYLTVQREQASFREELQGQASLLLETLPRTMRDPLYRQEVDELIDIARVVSDNESVTSLKIYDHRGAVLVDAAARNPGFAQIVEPLGQTLIEGERDQLYLEWEQDQLLAGRAIWLGNQPVGAVAIGLSTTPLDQKIAALTYQSILIAIVTLVLGVGMTFLFSRQITTPLSELAEVASQMAGGNLTTRVRVQSNDEVGKLGTAFNAMAEAIQKREADLRALAAGLERTVAERTAELRAQNEALIRANQELVIARRQAEDATQLKSQFLATMSHELRTPLNAVMGFSQLLLAGTSDPLTEDQARKIERILQNGQTLLELINDLLDLAKIEAGRIELINRPFTLSLWLSDVTRQLEALAVQRGLEFEVSLDKSLPEEIIGDPDRLKQILVNLLSNAIKFTERGMVAVVIKKQSDNTWAMIVSDTGIGIPSHALEYIFEEFRQVDGSPQRRYGGTGLGLAIVRRLVVMMGGSIRVTSTVGEGSVFTVQLPLVVEKASPTPEQSPRKES